jgi:alkanesulfonate monooxygenase SsuD/methylene tetrahydromethanopterin reductase-like flavin-dependent oxidoreductase (luciferase family)
MVSLNSFYGGRFILGLGVSHIPMVEGLRGHRYDKPLGAMRAYLDGINKGLPAGESRRWWWQRSARRCWR